MIVNIGKLRFVLFRGCSLPDCLDAKRSEWFAIFSANGMLDARAVDSIASFRRLSGSSSAHPLPHDVFYLFSVERFVGEEIVHDRR